MNAERLEDADEGPSSNWGLRAQMRSILRSAKSVEAYATVAISRRPTEYEQNVVSVAAALCHAAMCDTLEEEKREKISIRIVERIARENEIPPEDLMRRAANPGDQESFFPDSNDFILGMSEEDLVKCLLDAINSYNKV